MRTITGLSTNVGLSRGLLAAAFGVLAGFSAVGCSGEFHSDRGLEDMVCDNAGCWHCDQGACEEYRCDATHQCPMQRTCSIDQRCLLGGDSTPDDGRCASHDDCRPGQICTLDGACVTSPGGGPGDVGDVVGGDSSVDVSEDVAPVDASVDVGPGDVGPTDVGLPDHPDDVCLTNADCGLDGTCINGGCYFGCSADAKCPPGQGCDAGQCKPLATPENQCTFNGECGTTHVCLEGTCFVQCVETLDCPAHTRCATGLCVADTTPVLQCSGPSSCQDGKGCIDGKCLDACQDGACGAGFDCRFGYCHKTASCFEAKDCGGKDCVNGACAE